MLFSRTPGNKMPQLNDAALEYARKDRIPLMADNDSVVIVETEVAYDPGFEVGIPNHSFDNFIVTRPRYYPPGLPDIGPLPGRIVTWRGRRPHARPLP